MKKIILFLTLIIPLAPTTQTKALGGSSYIKAGAGTVLALAGGIATYLTVNKKYERFKKYFSKFQKIKLKENSQGLTKEEEEKKYNLYLKFKEEFEDEIKNPTLETVNVLEIKKSLERKQNILSFAKIGSIITLTLGGALIALVGVDFLNEKRDKKRKERHKQEEENRKKKLADFKSKKENIVTEILENFEDLSPDETASTKINDVKKELANKIIYYSEAISEADEQGLNKKFYEEFEKKLNALDENLENKKNSLSDEEKREWISVTEKTKFGTRTTHTTVKNKIEDDRKKISRELAKIKKRKRK